jgi:hypothetical protein
MDWDELYDVFARKGEPDKTLDRIQELEKVMKDIDAKFVGKHSELQERVVSLEKF